MSGRPNRPAPPHERPREEALRLRGGPVQEAFEVLREAVISGRLGPGSRVLETEAAERLSLSRSSVRAALHRLQQEGFLLASGDGPRRRLVVAPLSKADFLDLLRSVGDLEGLAAERLCELPMEVRGPVLEAMAGHHRELIERFDEAQAEGVTRTLLATQSADEAFHTRMVHGAGSLRLRRLHSAVRPHLRRYEEAYLVRRPRDPSSIEDHSGLLRLLEAGDGAASFHLLRAHYRRAANNLSPFLDNVPEAGVW